jgi:hypothetical protein
VRLVLLLLLAAACGNSRNQTAQPAPVELEWPADAGVPSD